MIDEIRVRRGLYGNIRPANEQMCKSRDEIFVIFEERSVDQTRYSDGY